MTGDAGVEVSDLVVDVDEAVVVRVVVKCELEYAVLAGDLPLAVRLDDAKRVERRAAGPDHELLDAEPFVAAAVGRLRGEPLVSMIVSADNDLSAVVLEQPPGFFHEA